MRRVVEIIGHLELIAISPTGFSRQVAEEGLLADAPMAQKYFLDGAKNNAGLRKVLAAATMIVCKVKPMRHPTHASAYLKCEFRREGMAFAQIEFIFAEDGKEQVCETLRPRRRRSAASRTSKRMVWTVLISYSTTSSCTYPNDSRSTQCPWQHRTTDLQQHRPAHPKNVREIPAGGEVERCLRIR